MYLHILSTPHWNYVVSWYTSSLNTAIEIDTWKSLFNTSLHYTHAWYKFHDISMLYLVLTWYRLIACWGTSGKTDFVCSRRGYPSETLYISQQTKSVDINPQLLLTYGQWYKMKAKLYRGTHYMLEKHWSVVTWEVIRDTIISCETFFHGQGWMDFIGSMS